MVVAIGDDEAALRVELDRVRRTELAGTGAGLADDAQELAVLVEDRDAADEIRIGDVGVALADVDVAIARVGDEIGRIGQRLRRIAALAWRADRQQQLAVGIELVNRAAFVAL